MTPYKPYLTHLDNEVKEAVFRAVLTLQLALNNFLTRISSPDTGIDVWVYNRKHQNALIPAQLKSCYGISHTYGDTVRRYVTNMRASRLVGSFEGRFLFFFGLYVPDTYPPDFHIGCIPASFLERHWQFLEQKKKQKGERINIELDHHVEEGRFYMFGNPTVEVSHFFGNFDAIG